jgi:hypothetical protein
MAPIRPLSLSINHVRPTGPTATKTILDRERLSQQLISTFDAMLAWTPQARLFPSYWAAEVFRQAGFDACVVEASVAAVFVVSEQCETRLTPRPHVIVGASGAHGGSDHAVVLVQDAATLVLFDPALSRLRHRAFRGLDDMFMAAIDDNVGAALAAGPGAFETALDWFLPAPHGGTVKLTWGVFAGQPGWADDIAYSQRTAKAALSGYAGARRAGYVMDVTSD